MQKKEYEAFFRLAPRVQVGSNQLELPVNWSVLAYHCQFVADMLELADYKTPKQLLSCFEIQEKDFQFIWLALNGVPDRSNTTISVATLKTGWEILDYLQLRETTPCYQFLAKITAKRLVDEDLDMTAMGQNPPFLVRHYFEIEIMQNRPILQPRKIGPEIVIGYHVPRKTWP